MQSPCPSRGRAKNAPPELAPPVPNVIVYAIDDDGAMLDILRLMLNTVGLEVAAYSSPGEFIEKVDPRRPGCVILDLWMPELNGFETLVRLRERAKTIPVVFLTGHGDVSAVIRAMRLGAVDFFEKPVNNGVLLESIQHWVQYDIRTHEALRRRQLTLTRLAKLSSRQRQVLDCVLKGMSNKETARHLGVSPKAIEISRALVMEKMGAHNVVHLILDVAGCLPLAEQIEGCPPACKESSARVSSIKEARNRPGGAPIQQCRPNEVLFCLSCSPMIFRPQLLIITTSIGFRLGRTPRSMGVRPSL